MTRTPAVPTETGTRGMREALAEAFRRAAREVAGGDIELPSIEVSAPPNPALGDFACNLALQLARRLGRRPMDLATALIDQLDGTPFLERAEAAPPGFINLRLSPDWLHETTANILRLGALYGRHTLGQGRKVLVEFVSANPTGPVTVANGRGGALGDALSSLLEFAGFEVSREYYLNDEPAGTQVLKFGQSLAARCREAQGQPAALPEGGYQGGYVLDLARDLLADPAMAAVVADLDAHTTDLAEWGMARLLVGIKATLERFGIHYDTFASEASYHRSGSVRDAIAELLRAGLAYEQDGATWLRSTQWGDDKDRVLVRATGAPTYLASDVAYHRDKFVRGHDLLIDIWGADHHGYVQRTKAAVAALGYDPDHLHIIIHQLVNLYRGQEPVRMSTRAGEFVTLDEVLGEVGRDATRFFMLSRAAETPVDFDLELAKQRSLENPVYYVQYAHTRCCSIFREAEERGAIVPDPSAVELSVLRQPTELRLQRLLADFPELILESAVAYEPHHLTRYGHELAGAFHAFYAECRVLGEEPPIEAARCVLVAATQVVLQQTLGLLGISAPDRM